MAIKIKSIAKNIGLRYEDAPIAHNEDGDTVITSQVFSTDGMIGRHVLGVAKVIAQVVGGTGTTSVEPTVHFSLDGVNFVDSPHAIAEKFTTAGVNVAAETVINFKLDLTDIVAPFMRIVWGGVASGPTDKDLMAGSIHHSILFSV